MGRLSVPRVSIGLPVFNGEEYLEECLPTILSQSFEDFELIISDNASSDRTEEICRSFAELDGRISYERQVENCGAAANFNRVFERSQGQYFKWMAHDDLLGPTWLERCVDRLADGGSGVSVAYTRVAHLDQSTGETQEYVGRFPWGASTPAGRMEQMLLPPAESILTHCYPVFGLMARNLLAQTRCIQAFNSADKVLLVELALRGDFVQVPEPLFIRRLHERNSLRANPSPQEVLEWFDPKAKRVAAARLDLWLGYRRAVREADLNQSERGSCEAILRTWAWGHRRRLLGDWLRRIGVRKAPCLQA